MRKVCPSGKKLYPTMAIGEDVLIELWTANNYRSDQGPVNVYQCDDCGQFHLTSQGPMNEKLAQYLSSDKARINKEASKWLDRFKKNY